MKNPLYISGITPDGVPLMAGLYAMKDEVGFPLDSSYLECQNAHHCPDWAEYLADAGRQTDWKFDAAAKELKLLVGDTIAGEIIERFKVWGATLMRKGDTFIDVCERMVSIKREGVIKS